MKTPAGSGGDGGAYNTQQGGGGVVVVAVERGEDKNQNQVRNYGEMGRRDVMVNLRMDSVAKGKEKMVDEVEDGKEREEESDEEEDGEEEVEEEEAEPVKPKLAEGFYEIEAVRRKRVRKGVVQYLIKWRDWPETANTWEPFKNLQSCSDVIEAFEERSRSGKGSSRRRKRRSGVVHAQPKKKQPRYVSTSSTRGRRVKNIADSPGISARTEDTSFTENPSSSEYNISAIDTKQYSENGIAVNSVAQLGRDKDCDLNMKLTELRGTIPKDDYRENNSAIPAVVNGSQPQETAIVNNSMTTSNNPTTGSRRRKSGKVRRFIPDSVPNDKANDAFDPVPGLGETLVPENASMPSFPATNHKILGIIKPLSYAPPEVSISREVGVTFLASRSDGKEVVVDNKFMKAYYPQLLIEFYEKNLRYNPV